MDILAPVVTAPPAKSKISGWTYFILAFVAVFIVAAVVKDKVTIRQLNADQNASAPSKPAFENSPAGREAAAKAMEQKMLSDGMDTHFILSGKDKTTVTIKYVLMSRPMVYKITSETDFLSSLKKVGFKKVIFTDGAYESWKYDL